MNLKDYLQQISQNAIKLHPENYTDEEKKEQWIGSKPATSKAIEATQKRLGTELPQDVKDLYRETNGTSEILKQTFGGFDPIDKIDWLKNIQPETIEAYAGMGEDYVEALNNSIVIAGANHPHMVLIIQPYGRREKWRYWEFAGYIPGENEFFGIEKYLDRLNDFLVDQIKNKDTAIPSIDYSEIIDALQEQDWSSVYANGTGIMLNRFDIQPEYKPDSELLGLCLLASSYLGNQAHFKTVLESLPRVAKNEALRDNLLIKEYIDAAEKKLSHTRELQDYLKYKPQENPKTLDDIELQINEHRKDLLKPEEQVSKIYYQLYFLYEFGNTEAFVKLEKESGMLYDYLKSARVYEYIGNKDKTIEIIKKYMVDVEYDQRIFGVYLDEILFKLIEKNDAV
jgi:hypothetical protein